MHAKEVPVPGPGTTLFFSSSVMSWWTCFPWALPALIATSWIWGRGLCKPLLCCWLVRNERHVDLCQKCYEETGCLYMAENLAPNDIQWESNNDRLFTAVFIFLKSLQSHFISTPQQTGTAGGGPRKCYSHTQKMSLYWISRAHEGWRLARTGEHALRMTDSISAVQKCRSASHKAETSEGSSEPPSSALELPARSCSES